MEPSNPFDILAELTVAKDTTNEKIRTLKLILEINIRASKLESQSFSDIYDPNPEIMFT